MKKIVSVGIPEYSLSIDVDLSALICASDVLLLNTSHAKRKYERALKRAYMRDIEAFKERARLKRELSYF